MKNNLVSVIITTKNSGSSLGECLLSIKGQSFKEVEIIVVDNNSTDNTKEIAKKYTDKVFNIGPERCTQRNFGAKNSTGKYLLFVDSDMKLSKDVVSDCVLKIEENSKNVGIIIPEESYGEGFWAQCKKLERSFYVDILWMQAARFFSKENFLKVGGYDENMVSGEDWDLSQRIEKLGNIEIIKSYIYHNEGRISLSKTLRKKYYYATKFKAYTAKSEHNKNISKQTHILSRYALYFRDPIHLFKNPIYGFGMLFMKTSEFAVGAIGLLASKLKKYE